MTRLLKKNLLTLEIVTRTKNTRELGGNAKMRIKKNRKSQNNHTYVTIGTARNQSNT